HLIADSKSDRRSSKTQSRAASRQDGGIRPSDTQPMLARIGDLDSDRGQRIRRDASGGPHDLDLLGGVEVVAAALIGVGASDVFGAGDVLRHTAFGGEGDGSE